MIKNVIDFIHKIVLHCGLVEGVHLEGLLASVVRRADVADIYRVSRADVVRNPIGHDPRDPGQRPLGRDARDIYIPDLRLGSRIVPGQPTQSIKINPRNFR